MATPITSIRNLGTAMSAAFTAVGIEDAETLQEIGADEAYAKLLANGHRPHFIAYLAVALGLQGRHWNDIEPAEKTAFRSRFDSIKSRRPLQNAKGRTPIDAALAEIGVIERAAQPTSSRPEKK
ncbi:TfoX/Sxy family DNA transformation protein [Meridianimarinicoccus aquatilis]|uniref:Competence protein TfoX n=1 Tax=Meridianimarinicoccus aquatilis TaxID=2552766 RepID=A0A4V3BBE0_9RHOB|nr:TfoX/Sxy family DNA transformation protein [Fluviibacterium aquatile]TDL86429.1 competence protein TfoX [Fluviibacterium aquatile]